jgi:hypothetical protein
MERLELKSTGALIDEYITSVFKFDRNPNEENTKRFNDLADITNTRVKENHNWGVISLQYSQLWETLEQCWEAQELVSTLNPTYDDIEDLPSIIALARAGKEAQRSNAIRCKLVREIDELLGESDRTYLEKTYS